MPEPRTAAEWASVLLRENCRHNTKGNVRGYCVGCIEMAFKVYARDVEEAVRAQVVQFLVVEEKHKDWKPVLAMFRRLITAIRALPAVQEKMK